MWFLSTGSGQSSWGVNSAMQLQLQISVRCHVSGHGPPSWGVSEDISHQGLWSEGLGLRPLHKMPCEQVKHLSTKEKKKVWTFTSWPRFCAFSLETVGLCGDTPPLCACPIPHPEGPEGAGPAPAAASCWVWGHQILGRSRTSPITCGCVWCSWASALTALSLRDRHLEFSRFWGSWRGPGKDNPGGVRLAPSPCPQIFPQTRWSGVCSRVTLPVAHLCLLQWGYVYPHENRSTCCRVHRPLPRQQTGNPEQLSPPGPSRPGRQQTCVTARNPGWSSWPLSPE